MEPQVATGWDARADIARRPLQIRGRFFTAVALRLGGAPDQGFYAALDARLEQTPNFFAGAPLVVDLEGAEGLATAADIAALADALRQRRLSVFGVQNGTAAQEKAAAEAGLIALAGGRDAPLRGAFKPEAAAPAARTARPPVDLAPALQLEPAPAPEPEPAPQVNRLITRPVRSGQTVVAEHGDLTIVGPVSSGAELIAAGNVHVYGQMRGRAMAGINGDLEARIFCQSLDAELLAIAGLYRTSDTLGPELRKSSVTVFLDGERLCVERLG
ncbi:septum site-determining protein MinC [Roseivivax isoporae]|uniref:Probable septum site-determining protein MinC n=1 Tax=Roseivivax isoporae LMG 25204 TaxID=1449351 RepID=X7F8Y2_9RHOB|nr:septum site-determining protein MinC [Roseivivax isoporae]ETX29372.1 selenocysteine lyase [Roseivivax isoporae LMG 25204]